MWIEAEKHCGVEYALFKTLSQEFFVTSNKVYYCSCSKIQEFNFYEFFENIYLGFGEGEPFLHSYTPKIIVIDHAELINKPQKILEFSKYLKLNNKTKVLCIFTAKRKKRSDFWKSVCELSNIGPDGEPFRKSKTIYTVFALTKEQVITIINESEITMQKKEKIINGNSSFPAYLHRHFFLDRLLSYLSNADTIVPDTFKDFSLLLVLYEKQLNSSFSITENINTFISDFLTGESMEEEEEASIVLFAWSYGIARFCSDSQKISVDILVSVFEEAFLLCNKYDINKFVLLNTLSLYNIKGAEISAKLLEHCFDEISIGERNIVFGNLCQQYMTEAKCCQDYSNCEKGKEKHTCVGEIKSRFSLGLSIGILITKMPSKIIEKSLYCFFAKVEDGYVIPKTNEKGISLCVITNFEYKKFVDDGGYNTLKEFGFPSAEQLKKSYYDLYKDLIEIVQAAEFSDNEKTRRIVSVILKGSDWRHYNRIAHVLAEMHEDENTHKIQALCDVLDEYYTEELINPVKWKNEYNPSDLFCNPLQPVVGITLFEARAYASWLSKKTGQNVHLVKYNPDYISIVGKDSTDKILSDKRSSFEEYKNHDLLTLINTRENSKCYYGPSNSELQEPAPIGLIQRPVTNLGLFDFCGNVFEMQDTEFTPTDQNLKVQQSSDTPSWQRVYNCSGGGWQHTSIRLPTEYMGQFTACTRNQDVGFRVVFGEHENFVIGIERY